MKSLKRLCSPPMNPHANRNTMSTAAIQPDSTCPLLRVLFSSERPVKESNCEVPDLHPPGARFHQLSYLTALMLMRICQRSFDANSSLRGRLLHISAHEHGRRIEYLLLFPCVRRKPIGESNIFVAARLRSLCAKSLGGRADVVVLP